MAWLAAFASSLSVHPQPPWLAAASYARYGVLAGLATRCGNRKKLLNRLPLVGRLAHLAASYVPTLLMPLIPVLSMEACCGMHWVTFWNGPRTSGELADQACLCVNMLHDSMCKQDVTGEDFPTTCKATRTGNLPQ